MSNSPNTYPLKNVVKQKTCFKNPNIPTCIDLIQTNLSSSFQDICNVETYFHKLVVTVFKLCFPKQKPNIQTFRDYKRFKIIYLDGNLIMSYENITYVLRVKYFLNIFNEVLNKHASMKEVFRTMTRSRFCNKYLKVKSID